MQRIGPFLFAVLATISAFFLVWSLPPFQTADEPAHIYRANMITHGYWVAAKVQTDGRIAAGGPSDVAIIEAYFPFHHVPFKPDERANLEDFVKSFTARWDGRVFNVAAENTAPYPPFFYLPQAAAIAVGKAIDLPVVQTLYLARAANALTCIVVGFFALLLAGRAHLPLFAVLLLPMSVSLYASMSQDGLVITVTALGIAFLARALSEGRPLRSAEVWASAVCFALVGMTKQPYALLCLMPLAVPAERAAVKRLAVAASLAAAVGWAVWMALAVQTPLIRQDAPTDAMGQLRFLLDNPLAVLTIAVKTFQVWGNEYYQQFVGILGWVDTRLPKPYYSAAYLVLLLSFLPLLLGRRAADWYSGAPARASAVTAAVVLATGALLFGALYMVWTPVGQLWVDGVQGRYFLPLAALLPLAFASGRQEPASGWSSGGWSAGPAGVLERGLTWMVWLFPIVSILVVQRTVILRYYLD
ncbi:DUF2142 domain-containing protein [Azospirillum palustre]